ncbi:hypothetical protein E2C01_082539 [Portunus trituberculatus]|uniref:Uncharacterized protein n=1 Tax=Portunus trituberculatus TaxID=210409 RepID=A0A5B7J1Z0_PORTR|nr:hypothetical protein [Portunus trituberculatus]
MMPHPNTTLATHTASQGLKTSPANLCNCFFYPFYSCVRETMVVIVVVVMVKVPVVKVGAVIQKEIFKHYETWGQICRSEVKFLRNDRKGE